MCIFSVNGRADRRGEKVFQLEDAAWRGNELVRCHPAYSRFMHPDGIRDGFQGKRSHRLHAVNEKAVLLANDFLRHLENGTSALVEAFDQPLRGAEAFAQIKLVLL